MKYKEYLCKTDDGYILQTLPEYAGSELIEVPEGAEKLTIDASKKLTFWNGDSSFNDGDEDWSNPCDDILTFDEYAAYGFTLLWQRPSQPEELPFIDDEPKQWTDKETDDFIKESELHIVDNVNHPSHYTNGKVECIDALESATVGKSGIEAVCVANVIKYLWRYEDKNGIEDVRKAQWYLNRLLSAMGD